jgi:hypothetical protein
MKQREDEVHPRVAVGSRMGEVAWGLRKISSGKIKSTLGLRSRSRMLDVVSGKKRSRSKSEMLHRARINSSF